MKKPTLNKALWNKVKTSVGVFVKQHQMRSYRYAGLAMVCYGIGMIFAPAGVIAGGIALLLIEWSVEEDGE